MTFAFGMVSVRVCVTLAALTMALGAAATTARASVVTEFTVPTAASQPRGIAAGPDGALWFTESVPSANKIGRITTGGTITEFTIPTASSSPFGIAAGSDGALWFSENSGKIGRITTGGTITDFTVPGSFPVGIAAGPDGALWFTENNTNKIGRITLDVGPAGPAGTVGTQGTAGTPGTQGTAGQPGTAGSDRFILAAAFGQDPYRARRGRSLTVRYVSTLAADVTVEIRKGSRVIKRQLARARAGRNKLTIRNLPRGTFTLRLRAFITGQTSTDTARLTVTR